VTCGVEPAANRHAFIFLAHLNDVIVWVSEQALEQMVTRNAVRQGDNKANAGALEFGFYRFSPERVVGHVSSERKNRFNVSCSKFNVPTPFLHLITLNLER
jgi:hypothetical protein